MTAQTVWRIPQRALSVRLIAFAFVGGLCFVIQYILLLALTRTIWPDYRVAANIVAFLCSAQVNFALSRVLTWGDRRQVGLPWRRIAVQALRFNLGVLAALGINSAAFWLVDSLTHSLFLAVCFGNGVGMAASYTISHFVVFRSQPVLEGEQ